MRAHLDEMGGAGIPVEIAVQRQSRGTADAVLAARGAVVGPLVVVNADDLYPAGAFSLIATHLRNAPAHEHAVVGFRVDRTLVGSRPEARALLTIDEAGALSGVQEGQVEKDGGLQFSTATSVDPLRGDEIVSMNMWAFRPSVFDALGAAVSELAARSRRPRRRGVLARRRRADGRRRRDRPRPADGRSVHRHHLPRRRRRGACGTAVIDGGILQPRRGAILVLRAGRDDRAVRHRPHQRYVSRLAPVATTTWCSGSIVRSSTTRVRSCRTSPPSRRISAGGSCPSSSPLDQAGGPSPTQVTRGARGGACPAARRAARRRRCTRRRPRTCSGASTPPWQISDRQA